MRKDFHPTSEHLNQRLDQYLVSQIEDISRSRVQLLIEQGKVLVNDKAAKASYRLEGGETITVTGPVQPPPLKATAEDIRLDILYEDESLAVVNKPAGMTVHAGASTPGDDEQEDPRSRGTLVNALLFHFKKLSKVGGELRPGIVHRLDKDTSGIILVAKSDSAHAKLAEQFSSRQVRKKYVALVHGWPKEDKGTINDPIGRDSVRRNRMSIRARESRDALTHFTVRDRIRSIYGKFALLDVTIETGRTHQIRVHLASLGHPVVGDTLYSAPEMIEPQQLGAFRAHKASTKSTRDRASMDLARELTEQHMGTVKPATKRPGKKAKTEPAKVPGSALASAAPIRLPRNFLHAAAIQFQHPRAKKDMSFEQPLPAELQEFLFKLRSGI